MLKQRILTALVMFPLLVWAILVADKNVWVWMLSVFSALSSYELVKMLIPALEQKVSDGEAGEYRKLFPHWAVFAMVVSVLFFQASISEAIDFERGLIALFFALLMIYAVFTAKAIEVSIARLIGLSVAVVYGCLPWLAVWDLFNYGENGRYLMFLILVVMGCDTGAYFGGKSFGKRKMSKNLSPNKTWEGLATGVLVAIAAGHGANYLFDGTLGSDLGITVVALFGACAGVLGDLIESGFKRFSGVKDSGKILPGHGGFLDRVDAILFSAPVVWFCFYLID